MSLPCWPALDIDAERGRQFGEQLGIAPGRCYADYQTLFREEALRPDGIEVVSVTTPNNTHFAITKAALEAGLHVICEKPLLYRRGSAAAGAEQKAEQNRRRHLRLCRVSDDPAGAADDCRRAARRDPHYQYAVCPRFS
jgi:predicted dehydrogenase